jgi:hypothetical protein
VLPGLVLDIDVSILAAVDESRRRWEGSSKEERVESTEEEITLQHSMIPSEIPSR